MSIENVLRPADIRDFDEGDSPENVGGADASADLFRGWEGEHEEFCDKSSSLRQPLELGKQSSSQKRALSPNPMSKVISVTQI